LVAHLEGGTYAEDVWKKGAEGNIWAYEGTTEQESGENFIMRSLMICTPHQILLR
jgi:hypothetical protein